MSWYPGKMIGQVLGQSDNPDGVDSYLESMREAKRREWTRKGYSPGLIDKGLTWADEWTMGMANRITKKPELKARVIRELYPQALKLADKWITGLTEFLG